MGHFFLGFDVHICSSELPPHEHYFPVAGRFQNNLEIFSTYFEPKLFSWVRRDAGFSMCKSDQIGDFKIINLVVDPQENNLHHQMAMVNKNAWQMGKKGNL